MFSRRVGQIGSIVEGFWDGPINQILTGGKIERTISSQTGPRHEEYLFRGAPDQTKGVAFGWIQGVLFHNMVVVVTPIENGTNVIGRIKVVQRIVLIG